MMVALILGYLAFAVGVQTNPAFSPGRVSLTKQANGIDGWLEVRIDPRIPQRLRNKMWGDADWSFELDTNDRLYKTFLKDPPKNATLVLIDKNGMVVEQDNLDTPLASIGKIDLLKHQLSIQLTEDYSVGWGSFAGPLSRIIEIHDGHLDWITAKNASTGKNEEINLIFALKSNWKLSESKYGNDILSVLCRPDSNAENMQIQYTRYHFDGTGWMKYTKIKEGVWEADEAFPSRREFP